MLISVGLSDTSLGSLDHNDLVIEIFSSVRFSKIKVDRLFVESGLADQSNQSNNSEHSDYSGQLDHSYLDSLATTLWEERLAPSHYRFSAEHNRLIISGPHSATLEEGFALILSTSSGATKFSLINLLRQHGQSSTPPSYMGALHIFARGGKVRCNLVTDLENYVRGVLQSEVPASYHLEAIKSQAVAARTYGLRPRIDHSPDLCNVCDSYLCCQYFGGAAASLAPKYLEAIETTKNKILTWQNKPILALFSSCSGGHTENFENCFSDLKNNRFPGQKLSYLQGVPEGQLSETKATTGSKDWLESLWLAKQIDTCDSWSTQFRWKLLFSANDLESHIHHTVVSELMSDPEYAPFIIPPKKEQFGHIQTLEVVRRGISGTAMTLVVKTSAGDWTFNKELVIRSIFKNCQPGLKRLKSAKVFFDHKIDRLGLLESLTVYGLGWGHGVGLQQTGAQGQALAGRNYVQILKHYYSGVLINEL